jgi:hypothetical protein
MGAIVWLVLLVLVIVPLWRIFGRAGFKSYLSLLVAIPYHVFHVFFIVALLVSEPVPLHQPTQPTIPWEWLVLIPLLALAAWFVGKAIKKAGYSISWTLFSFVPLVNLVMLWVFAYVKWHSLPERQHT